jgi:hypothetical protein
MPEKGDLDQTDDMYIRVKRMEIAYIVCCLKHIYVYTRHPLPFSLALPSKVSFSLPRREKEIKTSAKNIKLNHVPRTYPTCLGRVAPLFV